MSLSHDHLRYAGLPRNRQEQVLAEIIAADGLLMELLEGLVALDLPDPLLASGAIYNTVWNVLTGRPPHEGIKDADLVYFDASDLSYEAEDRAIRRAQMLFRDLPIPVELRNQARVHLWFPEKFGMAYPQLTSSGEMMLYFASKTHAVAARLEEGRVKVYAPFGLDDLFSFRMVPNPALDNRETHDRKGTRAKAIWPELTVLPWPR